MKTSKFALTIVSILAILFVAGCAMNKVPVAPSVVSQPTWGIDASGNIVQTGTTNLIVGGEAYVPNTNLTAGLAAGQAALVAAAAIPSPASPILGGLAVGLSAITTLLGLYARRKTGELTTANAALAATITAIEVLDTAGEIKRRVKQTAIANGSQAYLDEKVQDVSFETQ